MQLIAFIIVYPLIWLLSILPLRVLYVLSDGIYYVFYYIVGYRKEVVLNNLKMAFPEKSDAELKAIRKKFFKHFIDMIFESVKYLTISKKEIAKRYKYINPEVVNNILAKNKSIALVGAHLGNWEWCTSLPLVMNATVFGSYTKLKNPYYEKVVKKTRSKYGSELIKTSETIRAMKSHFDNKVLGMYILLSDQSPQVHKTQYWRTFFGITVPVHTGAEMLAKKFDLAVVNFVAKKVKRGYYEVTFETIAENAKDFKKFEIIDQYIDLTERNISNQPEYYLWSHKRFKHKDKVPTNWP